MYGQASLGSKATNQSQFLPTCVSDFVLFFFLYIYIFFFVEFYFIFNSLLLQTQWHCLSPKWCDCLLIEWRLPPRCG